MLLQGYIDYINAIPHVAPPGVFGLHDNADIAKDLQEAQQLLDGLLLSQSTSVTTTASNCGGSNSRVSSKGGPPDAAADAGRTTDGGAAAAGDAGTGEAAAEAEPLPKSREEVIAEIAADILAQLPTVFDLEAAEAAYPQDYFNSMNTVLVQVLGFRPTWMPSTS
jgi:dynein heavy chain